jgi:coenzyme Q-binding protein COQ10
MPRYTEHKILPYAPEDVFDLVADIAKYPEFLPWCLGARIRSRDGDVITADLIIGWKLIRETFTSRVTLTRPDKIHVDYIDGPMRYMHNDWRFSKTPAGACAIDFEVDFEFKSRTLERVMGVFFGEAVRRMVGAFEERASEKLSK